MPDQGMLSAAGAFIARLRRAMVEAEPLAPFVDDFEGLAAAIDDQPAALAEAIEAAAAGGRGAPIAVHSTCFSSACCDPNGKIVAAAADFSNWFRLEPDVLQRARRDRRSSDPRMTLLVDDAFGQPAALAIAPAAQARRWPLCAAVHAALDSGEASDAVICYRPQKSSLRLTAQALGLTHAETRLAASLIASGDLRRAAEADGIAYETARKVLASLMRKTKTNDQRDLILLLLAQSSGDLPAIGQLEPLMRDLFQFTQLQARLALLVARGESREQAARILRVSAHRVKDEMRVVFLACGVDSAAELTRLVAGLGAVYGLATACDVVIAAGRVTREPLRMVARGWADGKIAVADHGPVQRRPLIIFHTYSSGRHFSGSAIAALQESGYRPIVFDRAGYGLSDPVEGDPVLAAARDVKALMDALELPRAAILGRAATAACLATAAALGSRICGGVLLGPDSPGALDRGRSGLFGRMKGYLYSNPEIVESFFRLTAQRTSRAMMERTLWAAVRGQPADLAVLNAPNVVDDFVRGSIQALLGFHGPVAEIIAQAKLFDMPRLADAAAWTLLYGAQDKFVSLDDASAVWTASLPNARIEVVADGGRFLHLTHMGLITAALERAFASGG